MRRYFSSFVISFIVYASLIASGIYFVNLEDESTEVNEIQESKTVAFSIIQQQCHTKKEKIEKKVEEKKLVKKEKKVLHKPKPQPKVVEEEIVKKEIEPEINEVAVQEKETELLEEFVEEQEDVQEKTVQEESIDEQRLQEEIQQMMAVKKKELDLFTQDLIKRINENKHYPLSARRRGIEGDVAVKFIVLANGGVDGIEILEGKSIFEKSTISAIEDSFPVSVTNSLLEFPQEFKIKLAYVLK
ncbi:TonB family protein [Sulfurimonas sp. C5]|uniref:TonB family protein n=1 Tax=Sulfurimonas sp. C5 TaxID=3036947 RepID=UPI002453B956|nr:TonB family protein [Sulfurimonas sp. C5]MDH4944126.1 TonB family protein [Sulfurimonas sp. C5]